MPNKLNYLQFEEFRRILLSRSPVPSSRMKNCIRIIAPTYGFKTRIYSIRNGWPGARRPVWAKGSFVRKPDALNLLKKIKKIRERRRFKTKIFDRKRDRPGARDPLRNGSNSSGRDSSSQNRPRTTFAHVRRIPARFRSGGSLC